MNVEDEDEDETDDGVESLKCMGCKEEKDGCQCVQIIDNLKQVNSQLYSIGLMKKVAEPAFLSVIHTEVLYNCTPGMGGRYNSAQKQVTSHVTFPVQRNSCRGDAIHILHVMAIYF